MDADSVLELLDALEAASLRVWVDGGWGVDALLGEQTRPHADLDIVLSDDDGQNLRVALSAMGFRQQPGGTDTKFIVADDRGREVDVYLARFDQRGYGLFELPDGRIWPFPPLAFAGQGRIGNREVRCLSVDAQVQCHAHGYEPKEKDLRDMERIQERFGVLLPPSLCRQPRGR